MLPPGMTGAQELSVYGGLALKLITSVLVNLLKPCRIVVNVPTANIVPLHWTSWRTCSGGLSVSGRCGVVVAGRASTGPLGMPTVLAVLAAWSAGAAWAAVMPRVAAA